MKISGVDRCGCLIQSARLESSDLRRRYHRFQPPFRFAFNPLSQSDVTRARANPIRSERERESADSLFVPASLSLSFPLSYPLFPFLYPSSLSWSARGLMTVLPSRESLPGERFATEGCSYRFPGALRPFYFPRSLPALVQRLILNKLETGT